MTDTVKHGPRRAAFLQPLVSLLALDNMSDYQFLAKGEWRTPDTAQAIDLGPEAGHPGTILVTCTDGTRWATNRTAKRWIRPTMAVIDGTEDQ